MLTDSLFWKNKRVCVTGGTGFLGWHIVRQLMPTAAHVRILGLPPLSCHFVERFDSLDCVHGDVRDPDLVRRAISDCNLVFHAAGPVGMWGRSNQEMHDVHVIGTRNVLQALSPGARIVQTSSVVTIGASRAPAELSEGADFLLAREKIDYVHAKKAAEDLVLAAAANGVDAVVVNPGLLIGPEEYALSVLGRFCLRFWRGRLPFVPPGGFNVVDVRDAARGHLLAAQHGYSGQRYILGGENLTWLQICRLLAEIGQRAPRLYFRIPLWLEYVLAWCSEARAAIVRHEPFLSLQTVQLNRFYWYYSSRFAQDELGYAARPIRESVADAFDWFAGLGHFEPRTTSAKESSSQSSMRRAA